MLTIIIYILSILLLNDSDHPPPEISNLPRILALFHCRIWMKFGMQIYFGMVFVMIVFLNQISNLPLPLLNSTPSPLTLPPSFQNFPITWLR